MLSGLYINQQALAALAELILILAVIGPILRIRHRSRASNDFLGAFLFGGLLSLIVFIDALTLGEMTGVGANLWVLVWAITFYFLLSFAFSFLPIPTDPTHIQHLHRERTLAKAISIGFIGLALLPLLLTVVGRSQSAAIAGVSRAVSLWSVVAILWGNTIFWRKAVYASMESYPERKPWQQWLWPQGRYRWVVIALVLAGLFPIPVAVLLAQQPVDSSVTLTTALMICLLLIRFVGALIYYNYSEERISILIKLSVTTLVVVLALVILIGALIEPYYLEAFQLLSENADSADTMLAQRIYLHERMLPLFWLIIGLSAFILLGSPIFYRYILVVPLNGLMTSVRAVDSGDLTARATVYFPDEIGVVTDAFNRMVASVQEVDERLEAQVARRTKALAEATARAEAASKAKSDFLAHMSHELRTPLNGILGYAQILRHDETMSSDQIGGIDVIDASGRHLLTVIDDILDLSRIEADKLALNRAGFSLLDLLDGVIEMMRYTAEEKGLILAWNQLSDLPPRVVGDERRLRQVLINLLGNALKFTNDGQVSLQVNRLDDFKMDDEYGREDQGNGGTMVGPKDVDVVTRLRFAVQDTGIGLSAEQIDQIFLPFEQAQADGHSAQGAGLGLPISQRLVQLMGGEINVESQLDEGSRFWFDLTFDYVEGSTGTETIGIRHPSNVLQNRSVQPQAELLLPPLSDRIAIYESARLGDMHKVEIEANRLAQASERYRPFADRVLALAATFNDAAIQALVQPDGEGNIGENLYDA